MKVLIFTSQFVMGAAEKLAAELAVDLNRKGVHADLMGMYTSSHDGARQAAEDLRRRGVPSIHYLGLSPKPSVFGLIASVIRMHMIIRRFGYDIVETSSLTPGIIASWGRLGTVARHVVGLHYVFSTLEEAPRSIRLFAATMRIRRDTRFYAVSAYARNAWTRFSRIPESRIRVIYNCIPPRRAIPSDVRKQIRIDLGIPENSALLLCAGRIAAYKRQDLVVEAVQMAGVSGNLVVIFVGEADLDVKGTREMIRRIDSAIGKGGLESKVHFLGRRSDIEELMASSDLLVHATEKEAFGMVLVEALASGLPVVSTDVEGIPEVLGGTDSIMVRPGDPIALRHAVDKVLSRDLNAARRAREKGIDQASRFSPAERTSRMIDYFADILAGND